MKKIYKIGSAALTVCLAAVLFAAPVFAGVEVNEGNDPGAAAGGDPGAATGGDPGAATGGNTSVQPCFLKVWADTEEGREKDDTINYMHTGNVDNNINLGSSMTVDAKAHDHFEADATGILDGDLTVTAASEQPGETIKGVTSSATAKDQGTAAAKAEVTGTITVGSMDTQQNGVGINATATAPENSTSPTASSTVIAGDDVKVSSSENATGILVKMDSAIEDATVGSSVDVKGNVEATAGQTAAGIIIDPKTTYNPPGETSAAIHVGGDVNAKIQGDKENSHAEGIVIKEIDANGNDVAITNINADVTVGGSVNAEGGKENSGLYLHLGEESVVNISVGNNLQGDTNGAVIYAENNSQVNLNVKNNLTGGKTGLEINSPGDQDTIDVLVENTLSGGEHTIEVTKIEDLNGLTLTVWKAEVNNDGHIVAAKNGGNADKADIEAKEKEFLYIIKVEQPAVGGTLSLSKESGSILDKSHDYFVAKQDEMVLLRVNVEAGYQVTGAFNGSEKLNLYKGTDNVYYIAVPKGGGVYLTAAFEKLTAPTPAPEPTPVPTPTPTPTPSPAENREAENQEESTEPAGPVSSSQFAEHSNSANNIIAVLKKADVNREMAITFNDDGTYTLVSNDASSSSSIISGTYTVKNGAIELTIGDGNVSKIDKDGTLVLPYEKGTARFEFSSDDLTVLLSTLSKDLKPLSIQSESGMETIHIYENGIYKVEYNRVDYAAEYGTYRFEDRDSGEELIFTNLKGEEMIVGEDDNLDYVPIQSDYEKNFEGKIEFSLTSDIPHFFS